MNTKRRRFKLVSQCDNILTPMADSGAAPISRIVLLLVVVGQDVKSQRFNLKTLIIGFEQNCEKCIETNAI